jgi:hypothetical protein
VRAKGDNMAIKHKKKSHILTRPKQMNAKTFKLIKEIAQEAAYKVDKWMPEDEEFVKDYFNSNDVDRAVIIDENIDNFFETYLPGWFNDDEKAAMNFVNQHNGLVRAEIVVQIVKRL